MTESQFIELEHKLDKADDNLTALTKDVVALTTENKALKQELSDVKQDLRSVSTALNLFYGMFFHLVEVPSQNATAKAHEKLRLAVVAFCDKYPPAP